jgi:hypothetical protein
MNQSNYRLTLAQGFLAEAQQDAMLKRWRSAVDNAQLPPTLSLGARSFC